MDATRRFFVGMGMAAATAAPGLEAAMAAPAAMEKSKFWIAAVTACGRDYKFDEGAYRDHMAWWKSQGADGILVLGTNGEGPSFSVAERKRIAEVALRNRNGLDIIVTTGTANFEETIDLSNHAADHGADSVLVQPPFYFKNPKGEGVVDYFNVIFDKVRAPVRYYHIPRMTGVPVDLSVLQALAKHPNFIGLKNSNGDPAEFEAHTSGLPASLNVISGTDNNALAAIRHGNGVILGSGNVYTKQVAAIFAAHRAGKDINEPFAKLMSAISLMQASGYDANYNAIKYALGQMSGVTRMSYARPPHVPLSEDQMAKIRRGVAQLKEMG